MELEQRAQRRQKLGRVGAGVATWAVVCVLTTTAAAGPLAAGPARLAATVLLQLAYLAALLTATLTRAPVTVRGAAFLAQGALAFAVGLLLPLDWLQIYTIIWMAMVPSFVTGPRAQFALLAGVVAGWYLVGAWRWQDGGALLQTALFAGFHLFALVSARETLAAHAARDRAAALNRELLGTQRLLAETTRSAERTRIARDLHDMLGHHLTALSIHLQVASRTATGELQEQLSQCHALVRLLLSDVRETVGELRAAPGLDVTEALRTLVRHTPRLQIELDVPDPLRVENVDTASTLLRFVQEAITNTLRHAGARRLWIRITQHHDAVSAQVYDDGRVRGELQPGHGLEGMRERAAAAGGALQLGRRDGALHLTLTLPAAAAGGA